MNLAATARKYITALISLGLLSGATGCTFLSKCDDYNGLPGQHGKPVEFYSATSVGMNLVFLLPIVGDPTPTATLSDLTKKVKEDGGSNVRVISSGSNYLWYVLFPFTIIFTPVITSVSADAEFLNPAPKSGTGDKKTAEAGGSTRAQPASYQQNSGERTKEKTTRSR